MYKFYFKLSSIGIVMEKDLSAVCRALEHVNNFIFKYDSFGDAHMVDYFVSDHWNNLLDVNLRQDLVKLTVDELYALPNKLHEMYSSIEEEDKKDLDLFSETSSSLCNFINEAKACQLIAQDIVIDVHDALPVMNSSLNHCNCEGHLYGVESKEYMCEKKSHEVAEMSPIIHALCCACGTSEVLDIGSGKGYLSSYLSLRYGLNVTAVDGVKSNSINAEIREQKYLNYWAKYLSGKNAANNKHLDDHEDLNTDTSTSFARISKVTSVTAHVSCDMEFDKLNSLSSDVSSRCVIVGLHTCGDLASNIIRIFTKHPFIKALCVVGCCYHLLTETLQFCGEEDMGGFPMSSYLKTHNTTLSRNKRMLGLKAPERTAASNLSERCLNSEKSLFYRAILTVILKEEFHVDVAKKDIKVGKLFSKSNSFVDYTRKSLRKLKINDTELSDQAIMDYLSKFEENFKELIAFSILRQLYAPAVEAIIVLDKLCYLMENAISSNIEKCFISEIFNPVKSPRRYAIIALKS